MVSRWTGIPVSKLTQGEKAIDLSGSGSDIFLGGEQSHASICFLKKNTFNFNTLYIIYIYICIFKHILSGSKPFWGQDTPVDGRYFLERLQSTKLLCSMLFEERKWKSWGPSQSSKISSRSCSTRSRRHTTSQLPS